MPSVSLLNDQFSHDFQYVLALTRYEFITIGYRHQPGARAPIDAGKLVADNGKVDDYRYYLYCLNLNLSL
jgi:hypothetical protein